jgi:hypothetical protein
MSTIDPTPAVKPDDAFPVYGVVVPGHPERSYAIIGGRAYSPGDTLIDEGQDAYRGQQVEVIMVGEGLYIVPTVSQPTPAPVPLDGGLGEAWAVFAYQLGRGIPRLVRQTQEAGRHIRSVGNRR